MKHAIRSLRKYITRCLVALFLLCFIVFVGGLTSCENRETGERMRFLLDSLQQANRNYEEFTSDSLQLELCRYFDRWGNSNERMKAYYLLGRAYHDMGEVPHALEIYQQAAEIADTTREDCDYRTLRAIYGQMGELFHWQNLPDEELKAWKKYSYFSLNNKDTLGYINGYELSIGAAFLNNDTAKILEITKHAHDLYKKYGYSKYAAGVYATTIYIYLNRSQYQKAKELMDVYEKESGYVDEKGNICKPHEIYYYSQGLYQLGINNLDSAEILFRKSALSGQPDAPAQGLLMVYEKRGDADSIAKYARMYADANDSIHNRKRTEAVQRITSMYNYNRHQRIAEQAEAKAQREKYAIISLLFVISLFIVIAWQAHRRHLQKLTILTKDYENAQERIKNAEYNLNRVDSEKETVQSKLMQSQTVIDDLNQKIASIEEKLAKLSKSDLDYSFKQTEIYKRFKFLSVFRRDQHIPSNDDWLELDKAINKYFKLYHAFLNGENKLSENQYRVCLLLFLNFSESEIEILMDKSPKQINRLKTLINNRLFNVNDAKSLRKNIMRQGL